MGQASYFILERQGIKKKKDKEIIFRYDYIVLTLLGFLLGRAELFAGLFPLTLVYWIMVSRTNRFLLGVVTLAISVGLVWSGDYYNLKYMLAGLMALLLEGTIFKKKEQLSFILLVSLAYLLLALLVNYSEQALLHHYLLAGGEAVFIYLIAKLSQEGLEQLVDWPRNLTTLALLTLFLISNGLLIGLANLGFIPTVVLRMIMLVLIMGIANTLGLSYSVLTAVLYGLVLVSTGIIPLLTMVRFVIVALTCSLFYQKNKVLMIVGLILSGLLYSGFSPTIYDLKDTMIELGMAGLLFLLLPGKLWTYLFTGLKGATNRVEALAVSAEIDFSTRIREHLVVLARVFEELSLTFKEVLPVEKEQHRIGDFIFIFKNKACSQCQRKRICWQQERSRLYQGLKALINAGQKQGNLAPEIIQQHLGGQCPYTNRIVAGAKAGFELFQVNNFWRDRCNDKQEIVSEQLQGVSQIIKQFADSDFALNCNPSLASVRQKALSSQIELHRIEGNSALNSAGLNFTVEMEPCSDHQPCQEQMLAILNAEYRTDFRVVSKQCGHILKDQPCRITYGPVGPYRLLLSSRQKASAGTSISGDSFLYKPLGDGKDLIVLSDGMGVGKKAAMESSVAIKLLERIIDSGFDQKLAIKTINSALYLRNQEESFTTLDIGIFDTFTGRITFNKIGAVSSYIKRGWEVIEVDSSSLPAGILDRIDISSQEVMLEDGDFVIMFTDGVLDSRYRQPDQEGWFRQLLQNSSFDHPQELAEYIMEVIMTNNTNIKDDLTIIVFKIEEIEKKRRRFKGNSRIS